MCHMRDNLAVCGAVRMIGTLIYVRRPYCCYVIADVEPVFAQPPVLLLKPLSYMKTPILSHTCVKRSLK